MDRAEFRALAARGTLLLDGATGTCLRAAGMPPGACTERWILAHPEALLALQRAYVAAGSAVVYAPTLMANRAFLGAGGPADRLAEMNADLVALSRRAAGGRALVAGDAAAVPPTACPGGWTPTDVYREQVEALAAAGVDLLVAETLPSIEAGLGFLEAARSACALPVMCTLTMAADGRLPGGGDAAEAVKALQGAGAAAVGVNCAVPPDRLEAVVAAMKAAAEVPVVAKPCAGLPPADARSRARRDMTPDRFAGAMLRLVDAGADIVGGCCGAGPAHIRRLAEALERR